MANKKKKENINRFQELEYSTLKSEILQYIQNYQNVRNMMYVICLTMIGYFINQDVSPFYYLFPLFIIIPSFIISIHYVRACDRIAAYICVFYENNDNNIHWISSNYKLSKEIKTHVEMREFPKIIQKIYNRIHVEQFLPYSSMTLLCILLYFLKLNYYSYIKILLVDMSLGGLAFIISFFIIFKFQKGKYDYYKRCWEQIKESKLKCD